MAPGSKADARWRTNRSFRDGLGEPGSLFREAVQIRGLYEIRSVAAQIIVPYLVRHEEEYVGSHHRFSLHCAKLSGRCASPVAASHLLSLNTSSQARSRNGFSRASRGLSAPTIVGEGMVVMPDSGFLN